MAAACLTSELALDKDEIAFSPATEEIVNDIGILPKNCTTTFSNVARRTACVRETFYPIVFAVLSALQWKYVEPWRA
jgi:hypothetical protein